MIRKIVAFQFRCGATIFFEIFSISNTIGVNNAIKNIFAVNSNIKSSLLISIISLLKIGKVKTVATLNCKIIV